MIYLIGIVIVFVIFYKVEKSQQRKEPNTSVSYNFQTDSTLIPDDNSKWEIVHRKTERWTELGFGDGDNFPGYGRVYAREFKIWYCDVGSKVERGMQILKDKHTMGYYPENIKKITGDDVYFDELFNTKGYETLHTGLDKKNRKRWYVALVKYSPTYIETKKAIEKTRTKVDKEIIEVPEGWILVRNRSLKWKELGYDKGFPGYGKVYNVTFEVWYSIVGEKERIKQPNISVHLAFYGNDSKICYFERICNEIKELKTKGLNFERLSRTQGYSQLYKGLDNSTKRRWYLGLIEVKPTYNYTASAE